MKVLITGAYGMLGQEIVNVFKMAGDEVIETDKDMLDITNPSETRAVILSQSPDLVVNTAAYNFVDKVEENNIFSLAYAINALGPKNIATVCRERDIPFVHYSTDYVFSGVKPEGYIETDSASPISKYGQTKLIGEKMVQEVGGKFYICRLSKIFGHPGKSDVSKESFVSLMIRLSKEKEYLKIVNEEVGSPSYCPDIAEATFKMIKEKYLSGIYHLVNEGEGVTWYEFAKEIFDILNIDIVTYPVASSEFYKPAQRPKFAKLLNTKFLKLRSRQEALVDFLRKN